MKQQIIQKTTNQLKPGDILYPNRLIVRVGVPFCDDIIIDHSGGTDQYGCNDLHLVISQAIKSLDE